MARAAGASGVEVVIEAGRTRTFASALDWPGWARSGKTEAAALEALLEYAARYAPVAERAGLAFPARPRPAVVERVAGDATTDFGAPSRAAAVEERLPPPAGRARLAALVGAAWATLDAVAATAPPSLRKGPRGGGRDRDQVVEHVLAAETSYARKLGVRGFKPETVDPAGMAAFRAAVLEAIGAGGGEPPASGRAWPVRYAVRRIAWHALDHAWEIEDRSE